MILIEIIIWESKQIKNTLFTITKADRPIDLVINTLQWYWLVNYFECLIWYNCN